MNEAETIVSFRVGADDSAVVTFCGKRDMRKVLRKALAALDLHYLGMTEYPTAGGFLEVGHIEETCEVVIRHPDLAPDEDGVGHIVFSIEEAMNLSSVLVQAAMHCEQLKIARENAG